MDLAATYPRHGSKGREVCDKVCANYFQEPTGNSQAERARSPASVDHLLELGLHLSLMRVAVLAMCPHSGRAHTLGSIKRGRSQPEVRGVPIGFA